MTVTSGGLDPIPPASRKRRHKLHRARSVIEFRRLLVEADINLDDELASFVEPGTDCGVLLVGSLAEGTGTPSSDVDILVLLDSVDQLRAPTGTVFLDIGPHREVLLYQNGIEVNFTFVARRHLSDVANAFIAIAPALYNPKDLRSLPMLHMDDLRIVHRLRVGWPLQGEATVERWRDELLVDLLRPYLAIRYYVEMNELSEDAEAMIGGPPGAAGLVVRTAMLKGLLSVLAHEGFTGLNDKWILHWCERVESPVAQTLVADARRLLLEAAPLDVAGEQDALRRLLAFRGRVRPYLELDAELERAIAYLSDEISYVDVGLDA